MWNFLTRYFYLGQIFALQQFLNNAAHGAQTADETGDLGSAESDQGGSANGSAATLAGASGGDESGAPSAAAAKEATPIAGAMPAGASQDIPNDDGAPAQKASLEAGGGQAVAAAAATEGEAGDTPVAPGDGHHPEHPGPCDGGDSACGPHAGTDLDLDIPLDLGGLTEPVVALVDDTLSLVTDVVGDTTEQLLDVVGETVVAVSDAVDVTVDTLVATVDETVDVLFDVLHDVTSALPLVGPALAEVTDVLDNVISPTLDTVSSVLTGTVDVVTDTLVETADIFPALGDLVGSDVIPAITGTVSSVLNLDMLRDGDKHTDLSIAMQTDADAGSEPLSDLVQSTTSSLADALLGTTKDADSIDIGTDQNHGLLASIIADTKGGLAELFS